MSKLIREISEAHQAGKLTKIINGEVISSDVNAQNTAKLIVIAAADTRELQKKRDIAALAKNTTLVIGGASLYEVFESAQSKAPLGSDLAVVFTLLATSSLIAMKKMWDAETLTKAKIHSATGNAKIAVDALKI